MNFNKAKILTISLLILTFSISCSKDEPVDPIDAELLEYFQRFKEEGEKRGVTIDYEAFGIEGHLVSINDPNVVGKCLKYTNGDRVVNVDRTYFNGAFDSEREFVIFHELGHCALDRGHLDTADEHGNCISIMASSDQVCANNYFFDTRDEYLDELFR